MRRVTAARGAVLAGAELAGAVLAGAVLAGAVLAAALLAAAVLAAAVVFGSGVAHAGVSGGDGPGGTVTVGASASGSSGGAPGGASGGAGGSGRGSSPWVCTYTELVLNNEGGMAPGGPMPGSWYSVTCADLATGANTTATEWISGQPAAAVPSVDPYSVALEAERSLQLPRPSPRFSPAAGSVVNLPTWLWVDGGIWHAYSVTASVGAVSATAVATPVSVTWSMGDGGVVTCFGPGTPYDDAEDPSGQATRCSYTYRTTSAGQPTPDGARDDGAFEVAATVDWSVTWSAEGVDAGGALPPVHTSASTSVRVEQVESIDTNRWGLPGRPPGGRRMAT